MNGLRGVIAYTVKKLRESGLYRRTFVQKILYFALPNEMRNELFVPYLYGPYSAGIQRVVQYLEDNPSYILIWEKEMDDAKIKEAIDKLIRFINDEKITTTHLSQLAKVHFLLTNTKGDIERVKRKSISLGWDELIRKDGLIEYRLQELRTLQKEIRDLS
ncbi:hypothetical protein PAP_00825 [Palaeococcus pacificus DY20341]|uniref:Antitoxin SocA-like Panacea domain-containing protein n=1 Tax=Palaeococcus pacificus DY20341 TaxID=1343739 RepID=A0A075LVZ9_9EURY|nr:hypothetical protein [Palaeococcus pacificus]AIF68608.1 hypothetical protein PAP_00825 [Palaeococcus pacificus DY20341]